MPLILGIESTCDETAAAFVADGRRVLGETIASQVDLHAVYGGVVPEIASRAHIENLLPTLFRTCDVAGHRLEDADAIAVAHRPGLIGSLVVGLTAAKTLAWALSKPLVGVDHVHAHLYSVLLDTDAQPELPAVGLVASGGHTALYLVKSWTDVQPLGRTIDDAVGEAYDKVASILGLGYPGGPVIDRLAAEGDPAAVRFPRSMLGADSLDFSFSGLKTAVLYHVRGHRGRERAASELSKQEVRDVCASFQAACVDTLIRKLRRALVRTRARSVIIGGGVSANSGLRSALPFLKLPSYAPHPRYCTDNAAMTAGLASVLLAEGMTSDLYLDAETLTAI
jgi:N6-L-threonylcarbamoyladenine synthase